MVCDLPVGAVVANGNVKQSCRMNDAIEQQLEQRLGRIHARQRLGIEAERDQRVFGGGINFFHPENWYSAHALIRYVLRVSGLYGRGYRNTLAIQLRHNEVGIARLPAAFDGFRLLHMSDLHGDLNPAAMTAIAERVAGIDYDACVITGDFRAQTFGPWQPALDALRGLLTQLTQPVYAVLGNHDSVRMVPGLEAMGVNVLMNEQVAITRGGESIHLVGVDDPHYYRVDSLAMAGHAVPDDAVAVLLSHTPEIYRQAAHAGFDLMLCGHTHGGQICLPGGIPITLDARIPRRLGAGPWRYLNMPGYTTVGAGSCIVPVRLNCLPEVVVHVLRRR